MKQITLMVYIFMYAFFSYGQAAQIESFTLVETGSGNTIVELAEGTTLSTVTTSNSINIRANTVPAVVGSVIFSLNGPLRKNMTENVAPYTLFGDFNGEYFGENLPEGAYTLTATAYTEEKGGGIAGDPLTINFSVITPPEVVNFTLVEAGQGTEIDVLTDGTVIDEAVASDGISVIANTDPENVGSVVFSLTGPENREMTENVAPYTLFGDFQGEFFGRNLPAGAYNLTATPFLEAEGGGLEGTPLTINFTVAEAQPQGRPFVTTWDTERGLNTNFTDRITIPTAIDEPYNYNVDWGDGNSNTGVTGDITHIYEIPGIYTVAISGEFPRILFSKEGQSFNRQKIIDINQWGDAQWSSMEGAFFACEELDVSATDIPDLSQVTSTAFMFFVNLGFSGNPSFGEWDVSTIQNMRNMFTLTQFNEDISNWDVHNVTSMAAMFSETQFNQNIGGWDVGNVTVMGNMFFFNNSFNQDISRWNVSKVTNMAEMFAETRFDQDLGNWDISNVTDMTDMFLAAQMSVQNYDNTLIGWATLDTDETRIPEQVTLGVQGLEFCLSESARQDLISNLDWSIVGDIMNCEGILPEITELSVVQIGSGDFVRTLNTGDVLTQEDLGEGINIIAGTLPVNVGSVGFSLEGPIETRAIENVAPYTLFGDFQGEFFGESLPEGAYTLTATPFLEAEGGGLEGSPLTINFTVAASQPQGRPFVTTWVTSAEDNTITIPTVPGEVYNYEINWGDGNSDSAVTGDITHTYASFGEYSISINGTFPRIRFGIPFVLNNRSIILSVDQWGDISWTSMEEAFLAVAPNILATDTPDLSRVRSMRDMFAESFVFTGSASMANWDVSKVEDMHGLFRQTDFNVDIGNWNVGTVRDMSIMFQEARQFNQDIGNWNVGNVVDMSGMFDFSGFNRDLNRWDVSKVERMNGMFVDVSYAHDLGGWDISSVQSMEGMFAAEGFRFVEDYDNTLIGWARLDEGEARIPENIVFEAGPESSWCLGDDARRRLIDDFGWTIFDASMDCSDVAADIGDLTLVVLDITDFPPFDEDIVLLENGETHFVNTLFNFRHTIRAATIPENVGSVSFSLAGAVTLTSIDNTAPYRIVDNPGLELIEGSYTLSVTPYSGPDGTGLAGETRILNFTLEGPNQTVTSSNNVSMVSMYPNKASTTVNIFSFRSK